jgi:hypothetical protein
MTFQHRRWHARLWPILSLLVLAGVIVALLARRGGLP